MPHPSVSAGPDLQGGSCCYLALPPDLARPVIQESVGKLASS